MIATGNRDGQVGVRLSETFDHVGQRLGAVRSMGVQDHDDLSRGRLDAAAKGADHAFARPPDEANGGGGLFVFELRRGSGDDDLDRWAVGLLQ